MGSRISRRSSALSQTRDPIPPFSPAGQTLVFMGAGQSNLDGEGSYAAATFNYTFSNTKIWVRSGQTDINATQSFQNLVYGPSGNSNSTLNEEPSPIIFIARAIERLTYLKNPLRVIQLAVGGSSFQSGTSSLGWSSGQALRGALTRHYSQPGLSSVQAEFGRDKTQILPFLWVQGENDANNETASLDYRAKLVGLFLEWRTDIGIPDHPIVVVKLSRQFTQAFRDNINAAFDAIVRSDKNVYLIDPNAEGIPLSGDNIHYAASGYERLALEYLKICREVGSRRWGNDNSILVTQQPSVFSRTNTSATFQATADEYGTFYIGVYSAGSPNPGTAAIKAGTGAGYLSRTSTPCRYGVVANITITGLTAATEYAIWGFVEGLAGNQSPVRDLGLITTNVPPPITATGGTITEETHGSVLYQVHEFLNTDGTGLTVSGGTLTYSAVIQGGGGPGDFRTTAVACGAGGGGQTRQVSGGAIAPGTYPVTVGDGGVSRNTSGGAFSNGGSSIFNSLTALGGAAGDGNGVDGTTSSGGGGNGGGGSPNQLQNNGGINTAGAGNVGGSGYQNSTQNNRAGGGGGGSGGVGGNAGIINSSSNEPGSGGAGTFAWNRWWGAGGQGSKKGGTWTSTRTNSIGGAASSSDANSNGVDGTGAGGAGIFSSTSPNTGKGNGGKGSVYVFIAKSQLNAPVVGTFKPQIFIPTETV